MSESQVAVAPLVSASRRHAAAAAFARTACVQAAVPVALIAIVVVALVVGLIPKRESAYNLHVDEWSHFGDAEALLNKEVWVRPLHMEAGFHALLAALRAYTGLDWFTLFRWLPPAFFAITVLTTYVLGRRLGFGLPAACLATLVPTSIRMLGPSMLVPVALALMALPLLLFFIICLRPGYRQAAFIGLMLIFVGAVHPTSAVLLAGVAGVCWVLSLLFDPGTTMRARLMNGLAFVLIVGTPAAAVLLWRWEEASRAMVLMGNRDPQLPPVAPMVLDRLGPWLPGLAATGVALLLARRTVWMPGLLLVGAGSIFLWTIALYAQFTLGYESLADRAWLHFWLMIAISAAYAITRIGEWAGALTNRRLPAIGGALAMGLMAGTLVFLTQTGLRDHAKQTYYQLASERNLADFRWIGENLDAGTRVAVLKTDLAYAYGPLAKGPVYTLEAFPVTNPDGRAATDYLFGPQPGDDRFWRERNIELVYAPHWGAGTAGLDAPRPGIYLPAKLQP